MPAVLLDRDGVVIVNRPTNVKSASDIELLPGAADAIARLNAAGCSVAICTNQPEVARGVLSQADLDTVHRALERMLESHGARVGLILCCGYDRKCPRRAVGAEPDVPRNTTSRSTGRVYRRRWQGDRAQPPRRRPH